MTASAVSGGKEWTPAIVAFLQSSRRRTT